MRTATALTAGGRSPALQAEALALLLQLAPPDHVPEGALELRLLPGVQSGELEELLDPERVLGFRQVALHVLRKFGHKRSQRSATGPEKIKPGGPQRGPPGGRKTRPGFKEARAWLKV
jgi:hypothetical protein